MNAIDLDRLKTPLDVLQKTFGFPIFRDGQQEAIEAVLDGQDVLAVMPTGSGKSVCFQIPALLLPGVTLVISPLIALMKDQVDALSAIGVPATFLNSTLDISETERRIYQIRKGEFKLLYVAPERFRVATFRQLIQSVEVSLLAVDEAHCVSQWGHDFRPSYLQIKNIREQVGNPNLIALTATATPQVQQDIAEQLKLTNPRVLVKGFDRKNLKFFAVELKKDEQKKRELMRITEAVKGPGIVYVATQKTVAEITIYLNDNQVLAVGYHGGMDKHERDQAQNQWLNESTRVIVATNAFGMGIDKPNVRFVLHYNIPGSLEAYYQEAGRAGRDSKTSYCVLLYNYHDRKIQEYLIENSFPPEPILQEVYEFLFALNRKQILLTYREIAAATDANDMQVGSAVKLFEKYKILARMKKREMRFSAKILQESSAVSERLKRAPLQYKLFTYLKSEPFGNFVLEETLKKLAFTPEQFNNTMRQLMQKGLIAYEPPFRGRGIEMIAPYKKWEKLSLDFESYHKRKQQQFDHLERMEKYILDSKCRRAYLLHYFGERYAKSNCASCDVCLDWKSPEQKKSAEVDSDDLRTVLECVQELDGIFGVTTIASILKGANDARFKNWGTEDNYYFGVFARKAKKKIIALLYVAIEKDLLKRSKGQYPKLQLTSAGHKYLSTH